MGVFMKLINSNEIIIKKSRFLGFYYEIENSKEADIILESLKKAHKKARHFPFAYKVNGTARKSDDKEPSGTAGMPIYTVLERKKQENILVVVIRYFGGIKLGAGGLFRAYMECANKVIEESSIDK